MIKSSVIYLYNYQNLTKMQQNLLPFYKKITLASVYIMFALAMLSCGSKEKSKNYTTNTSTTTHNSTTTNTPPPAPIEIKLGDKTFGVLSSWNETETAISLGNKAITGRLSKNDKTKYYDPAGDVIAEIKYKETSFKLRKPDGTLLWKVKIKDNKIKISDNAENEHPYEVKKKEGTYKIKRHNDELGKVTFDGNNVKVKTSEGTFKMVSNSDSYAFGVLAIKEIPAEHRLIIMAELLKGKK
ncbi:hypothetical protein M23134_06285 [Microscilla marina ATCC 23134]|uniref:Uncharacterized protein n=2 Tax=Microscilla marina TaxID=1027 RepID=A1ZYT4_MICM2|nr:hypothetical protein M23134_06285 [Microscilla marina ATCC 23134]